MIATTASQGRVSKPAPGHAYAPSDGADRGLRHPLTIPFDIGASSTHPINGHKQLDILALEPFYGGPRRAMLDAITRCSRHRWTILKLPPRKIERRLLVSATWFAEQLARHEVGKMDLLFASEALNLADFFRLTPAYAGTPAVVYFHDTQIPGPDAYRLDTPTDLANLNSAMAESEIWFNSLYNLRTFLSRASALVARHRELQMRSPLPVLTGKAQLVPPPVDMTVLHELAAQGGHARDSRSVLVDARGGNHGVIAEALKAIEKRRERIRVSVIGKVKGVPESKVTVLSDRDELGHARHLLDAGVLVSTRPGAPADDLAVRALSAGCHPVFPHTGVYPELLPEFMHSRCLHDGTPESLLDRLLDSWSLDHPAEGYGVHIEPMIERFDAIKACRNIDDRLSALAGARQPTPV